MGDWHLIFFHSYKVNRATLEVGFLRSNICEVFSKSRKFPFSETLPKSPCCYGSDLKNVEKSSKCIEEITVLELCRT